MRSCVRTAPRSACIIYISGRRIRIAGGSPGDGEIGFNPYIDSTFSFMKFRREKKRKLPNYH